MVSAFSCPVLPITCSSFSDGLAWIEKNLASVFIRVSFIEDDIVRRRRDILYYAPFLFLYQVENTIFGASKLINELK